LLAVSGLDHKKRCHASKQSGKIVSIDTVGIFIPIRGVHFSRETRWRVPGGHGLGRVRQNHKRQCTEPWVWCDLKVADLVGKMVVFGGQFP